MGADMCLALAILPKGQKPKFEEARTYIDTVSEADVLAACAETSVEDIPYFGGEDMDELREAMKSALSSFERAVTDWHREAATLDFGDKVVYASGGLSWGDAPTELYEEIQLLIWTGVMPVAGFES